MSYKGILCNSVSLLLLYTVTAGMKINNVFKNEKTTVCDVPVTLHLLCNRLVCRRKQRIIYKKFDLKKNQLQIGFRNTILFDRQASYLSLINQKIIFGTCLLEFAPRPRENSINFIYVCTFVLGGKKVDRW